jgi:hypothetical protein
MVKVFFAVCDGRTALLMTVKVKKRQVVECIRRGGVLATKAGETRHVSYAFWGLAEFNAFKEQIERQEVE